MIARIWNVLLTLFLLVAAALVIAFAGVRLAGLTPYAVLSGSMEPQYPVGSLIYVKDADPSSVEVGQAITFRQGSGTLVTHQVYEIDSEQQLFYTQGIANVDSSGEIMHDAAPTPWSSLVGQPIACVPYLGYVNDWITHAPGIYVVVAFVAVVMAISVALELRRMTLEKRRAEELERHDEELRQRSGSYGHSPIQNAPYGAVYNDGYAPGYGAGRDACNSGYVAGRGPGYVEDFRRAPYGGAAPNAASPYREHPRPNQGFASVNPPRVGSSDRRGAHARPQEGARGTRRR
ncbi:signal peptidase I [Slackia sp.]|uniref:signal peptidase I n=1 Tax=Slackia sp. TaxID=2049041 RepID=UPI003A983A47